MKMKSTFSVTNVRTSPAFLCDGAHRPSPALANGGFSRQNRFQQAGHLVDVR